jgi:hypothetical protein
MKNITRFVVTSILTATFFASQANAESKVRLVVTKEDSSSVSAMSFGKDSNNINKRYDVVEVETDNVDAEIARLKMQEGVKNVEISYPTSIPKPIKQESAFMPGIVSGSASNPAPNDSFYLDQYSWKSYTSTYRGRSNIEKAYVKAFVKKKVNVAVLDSGFRNTADMTWTDGYNFSTIDLRTGPDNYLDYDPNSCTTGHGQAVGEIIGATTNNAYGMAGIVDANMYAVRVLGCSNSGFLDEAAEGLRWAAGDPTVNADNPIGVEIDVVNMSLGAKINHCPTYMQEAIDYAVGKGITVVVAAGNDSVDASNFTPANCNNVINVGAVDRFGDQSYYSNFGSTIDVSALGSMVLSAGTTGNSDYSYWVGTSFAAPIQTGIIAMGIGLEPSLTPDEIEGLVKQHTNPLGNTSNYMGTGVIDALSFYNSLIETNMNSILKTGERCTTSLYIDNDLINACEIFEVSIETLKDQDSEYYVVFEVPEGEPMLTNNGSVITASQEKTFLVKGINIDSSNYGVQFCSDAAGTDCDSNVLFDLKDDEIDLPADCSSR